MKPEFSSLSEAEYRQYFSDVNWYKQMPDELKYYMYTRPEDAEDETDFRKKRDALRWMCADLYKDEAIALGKDGIDLDEQRRPVRQIVIHHSKGGIDVNWQYMNIQHMFKLYIPHFLDKNKKSFGKPLWSNHLMGEQPTFIAYHWLVWPSGEYERTLPDSAIGWHAGDWEVNTSSIAICLIGDYSVSEPPLAAIKATKEIINQHYFDVKEILGHNEVIDSTVCPGEGFLGESGWKQKLLSK